MSERVLGAVFDLDGLLIESESRWKVAERRFVEGHGGVYSDAIGFALTGSSAAESMRVLGESVGWTPDRSGEVIDQLYGFLDEAVEELGLEQMPGAADLVRSLAGRMPLAIASNTRTAMVLRNVERSGLPASFAAVLGSDGLTPKPAPDIYLAACRAIGVPPERALAFEDSVPGAAAARAAGMIVVAVPTHADEVIDCDLRLGSLAEFSLDLIA